MTRTTRGTYASTSRPRSIAPGGAAPAAVVFALAALLALAGCAGTQPTPAATPALPAVADRSPAAAPGRAGAGCDRPTVRGWLAAENARPGRALHLPADLPGSVLGYLDTTSARCGESVGVHLGVDRPGLPGTTGSPVHARVVVAAYRIGWYHGAGARPVWRSRPVTVGPGTVPSGAVGPHLVTPRWPVTVRLTVDRDWAPGFYLLLPQDLRGRPAGPAIPLVVRDDAGSEPILFQASTLTWNAYDEWGGWSLYHGPAGPHARRVADRARIVSLQRPLTGSGYDQLTYMDLPVIRQIEALATATGVDAAYTTDVAVDADPTRLLHHAEIVCGGHSEYWTRSMYDGLLTAADAGVNLVFLGANNLWWHARLEGGSPGRPAREVVYRVLAEDPAAVTDPSAATVLWQAAPLLREPAHLLGQSHAGIGVRGGLQLLDPPAWYLAGTGLHAGSVLPGSVGNEADGFNRAGHNPARTQVLAAGLLTGSGPPVLVTNSYSTRPSGAAVFAAGTTDWACAPTGDCKDLAVPEPTARAIGTLTRNVLLALSTPRAGLTHPARALAVTAAAVTVDRLRLLLPPTARGTYGGVETDELARNRHR